MHGDPARFGPAAVSDVSGRAAERRRGVTSLLAALVAGAASGRDVRAARERLEEELRTVLRARTVLLRESSMPLVPPASNAVCFDVPVWTSETRARFEAVFDGPRALDDWACQQLEAAAQVAGLLLELERAQGRGGMGPKRHADGAAPLIGSSDAIRRVRERIERVAATDFTVLIEGESGPEPHPNFIGILGQAPPGGGQRPLAGAGKHGAEELRASSTVGRPIRSRTAPAVCRIMRAHLH